MVSRFFPSVLLLAGHLGLSVRGTQADSGGSPYFQAGKQGYFQVVEVTDGIKPDLANRVGCMSETGAFTLDDCAVFTVSETIGAQGISSPLGNCSFADAAQKNVDADYGHANMAWICGEEVKQSWMYYTFGNFDATGTDFPVICHGNEDCFEDVKAIPKQSGERQPLWAFSWGSTQFDVPPGHTKTQWIWVPVNQTTSP